MTLLQSLFGGGQPRAAGPESPQVPLTAATLVDWLGGPRVHSGARVTEKTVLGVPAAWRAITLISGVAGALPLHAFKADGRSRQQLASGQAADLLADPHPDLTPFELWELGFGSLCTHGNAYFRKLRNPLGVIRELWWLNPDRVKAGRTSSDGSKVYVVDGDEDNPLTDREILHIPGWGYDGVCGVSPIRAAREGFGLAMAAEEYGARLFGSGSLASGLLQTEQRLDQTKADELKARWKARASGLENAHDIAVMDMGTKFQQLTIPPADAQFLQSRQFQLSEIGRMFHVPPILLFDMERSTSWGTGVEQQMLGWIKFGLQPQYLTRVEQRLTKMLRPQPVYARYSLEGLLRGDTAARSAFYTAMWDRGVFSTNEVRELEDREPVEGGDVRYRPLNMGVLGQADAETEPADVDPVEPVDEPAEPTDADTARLVGELVQKLYLGTPDKVVLTADEARMLLNRAGADLTGPAPEPPPPPPAPVLPAPAEPADDTADDDEQEEVPA